MNVSNTRLTEIRDAYYAFVEFEFGVMIHRKEDSLLMRAAATGLGVLRVQTPEQFLHGFATTYGDDVYVPQAWPLLNQISVIPHELTHTLQFRRLGRTRMILDYAFQTDVRGEREAEAMVATLQMIKYLYGYIPSAQELADGLGLYACRPRDIALAERLLRSAAVTVRMGGTIGEPTAKTIAWLDKNAPELRSP